MFQTITNAFSNTNDLASPGFYRQPTRERRATIRYKRAAANVKIIQTGYLFKKSGNNNHKQYYFVLSEESLTFYRKKNDNMAKGEINLPVKIQLLPKYIKKHSFRVIPLKLNLNQTEFIELISDEIILYSDNQLNQKEWINNMNNISQRKMEPYIFPDPMMQINQNMSDNKNNNDQFNSQQQQMHDKLNSMLDTNYFGLSTKKSKWRSPLSLRGLTYNIEDISINKLNKSLRIGEVNSDKSGLTPNDIISTSSLCVHNESNLMIVGCQPRNLNNNNSTNNGELQIYNCVDDADNNTDLNLIKKWQISDGIVDIDWRENILLISTNDGRVYYYQIDIQSDDTVYLVAHNELNPSEPIIYTHNTLQQISKYTLLSAPGSWMHSLRINQVRISSMKSPDCFLCIENESFHLWSLNSSGNISRPVYSQKASTSPLFCIEWNPHHNHQFMVGGVSKNLKIIDTRELTNNPSKSVPWKVKNAHNHSIKYISWNPLIEYWIATSSDDGTIKIWDIRYNTDKASRKLSLHNNVVNNIKWSLSHHELLISGSDDRTLKLWNIRNNIQPHYLLYSHLYSNPVIGCGYSSVKPNQFYGLSSTGELNSIELKKEFVKDIVPHRFNDKSFNKQFLSNNDRDDVKIDIADAKSDYEKCREIELLIYLRDMNAAHSLIPLLADKQWNAGHYDTAQDLLNLVSTVGFQSTLAKCKERYTFNEVLNRISLFYHPLCIKLTLASPVDVSLCEQMKLRMFIRKVLNKKQWKNLLIMEDKIFKHLMEMSNIDNNNNRNSRNNTHNIIVQIIELLKQYSYINSIKWCIRANNVYYKHNKYSLFLPIIISLLYPTIYHFNDKNIIKNPDPSLLRKSAQILDVKLRNYNFIKWQLNLLLKLNECIREKQYEQVSTNIIKTWNNAQKNNRKISTQQQSIDNNKITLNIDNNNSGGVYSNISQSAYRLYFNSLLNEGLCDIFFIEATRLSHQLKGYEISYILTDIMDNEGYIELNLYLENQLSDSFDDLNNNNNNSMTIDEIRLNKCCLGVITIVNICENCPQLPKCLKKNLPSYLKKYSNKLQNLFKLLDKKNINIKNNMIKSGNELINNIKQIQENKLNTEYFFRNEIHNLMTMVQAFCS